MRDGALRRPPAAPVGMRVTLPPLILDRERAQRRSRELRGPATPSLRHRRRVAAYATACAGLMGFLSLYQQGIVRRLPELPLPGFDANRVDASAEAYQLLGVPDAALGVVSYATTALLAGAGGARPSRAQAALLAAKAAVDAGWAVKLTLDQATKHRAACSYCLVSTVLTAATLREAGYALREASA